MTMSPFLAILARGHRMPGRSIDLPPLADIAHDSTRYVHRPRLWRLRRWRPKAQPARASESEGREIGGCSSAAPSIESANHAQGRPCCDSAGARVIQAAEQAQRPVRRRLRRREVEARALANRWTGLAAGRRCLPLGRNHPLPLARPALSSRRSLRFYARRHPSPGLRGVRISPTPSPPG